MRDGLIILVDTKSVSSNNKFDLLDLEPSSITALAHFGLHQHIAGVISVELHSSTMISCDGWTLWGVIVT